MYLRFQCYNSPKGTVFERVFAGEETQNKNSGTTLPSGQNRCGMSSGSMKVVLKEGSDVEDDISYYEGTLEVDPGTEKLKVIALFGWCESAMEALEFQYRAHSEIEDRGVEGIPKLIGLFRDPDFYDGDCIERGPCILMFTHFGTALQSFSQLPPDPRYVSLSLTLIL